MNNAQGNSLFARADGSLPAERHSTLGVARSQGVGYREGDGPLKQIIANQDSLYRYLNWEDPARTLGSYFAALGFLFAVHHLHITQWALKAVTIALGVMSVTGFASRSLGPDNFLARLRPRVYKTVPEPILNATLNDIHDLIQFAVVRTQKLLYAQDLSQTFAAFLASAALYLLIQVMPPFGLTILSLTTVYIIPLITSPRGKDIAQDGIVRAQEIGSAVVDKGNALAQDSKNKVADLSNKAQDTAEDVARRAGNLGQSGTQTATDATTEGSARLPQAGHSDINQVPGTSFVNDGNYSLHDKPIGATDSNRFVPRAALDRQPQTILAGADVASGRVAVDDLVDVTNSKRNDVPSFSSGVI